MAALGPIRDRRILVVEDEPAIAGVLVDMLGADGHHVETAVNGKVALRKIEERAYDLIVSDMRMPELDGPGLYRELAQRKPDLVRRFLFISGTAHDPNNQRFLADTAVAYLPKPFTFDQLHRITQRLLAAE